MVIKLFPALNGDCILVDTHKELFLIDGGYVNTFQKYLKSEFEDQTKAGRKLSHLIVTHIDRDHISGIVKLLEKNNQSKIIEIENVWHNSYRQIQEFDMPIDAYESAIAKSTDLFPVKSYLKEEGSGPKDISAEQGSTLAALIAQGNYGWNREFSNKAVSIDSINIVKISDDITLRLLSPNNEKLTQLARYWRKELYKLGYSAKLGAKSPFDDAFEFLLAMGKSPNPLLAKDISHSQVDLERLSATVYEEDTTPTNGSSISFILEYKDLKLLFLADSHPSVIVESLKTHFKEDPFPIKFDLIKISHHGSNANTSTGLLNLIDSARYVISTNGKIYGHPELGTLARIITRKSDFKRTLYFNYPVEAATLLANDGLMKKYNYNILTGSGDSPLDITL